MFGHRPLTATISCLFLLLGLVGLLSLATNLETSPQAEAKQDLNSNHNNREHGGEQQKLPDLKIGVDIFTLKQLEQVEKFFYKIDSLHGKHSLAEVSLMGLTSRAHVVYDDMLMHRYDNPDELLESGGPEANQEVCLRELDALLGRAKVQATKKLAGQDINFHQLMDTYGRSPPGLLLLNTVWPGMMTECERLKILTPKGKIGTRYCLASIKYNDWPETGAMGNVFTMKTGVCLPKACDSSNHKNKYRLIERLIDFNAREIDRGQYKINSLYCLPDSQSQLRTWWRSPKTLLFVTCVTFWLLAILYSSSKYANFLRRRKTAGDSCNDNNNNNNKTNKSHNNNIALYRLLSIGHNAKQLFAISEPPKVEISAQTKVLVPSDENDGKMVVKEEVKKEKRLIVDLRAIEGIKVFCMSYIILGHVLMCFSKIAKNQREFAEHGINNLAYILAQLTPGFAVNAFFCITGILTTYMIFKKQQERSFMNDPVKWVALIFYRYLRIMPMYVIVVAYLKYVARYTGSGPSWDYGTSALSPRRKCEDEPWLVVLGFGANLKSPLEHCIPSAWYLANDFQFFCVTPIFMCVLNWRPDLGKKLLKLSIGVGFLASLTKILFSDAPDLRPVMEFMPHAFVTHVMFLSDPYTGPIYRIPAYLCGLLIGYELFDYERRKINYLEAKMSVDSLNKLEEDLVQNQAYESEEAKLVAEAKKLNIPALEEPMWPELFIKWAPTLGVLSVVVITALPVFCPYLPFNDFLVRLSMALFWPIFHIAFSLAIGSYLLLSSTGYGNQFINRIMAANIWKPLARLSLCVVLINIGVVDYIRQTRVYQVHADLTIHLTGNMYCIIMTYLTAILVYTLFESPLANLINHGFNMLVNKSSMKQKSN